MSHPHGDKLRKLKQPASDGMAPAYFDDAAEILNLLHPLSATDRSVILKIVLAVAQAAAEHGDGAAEALLDRLEAALAGPV